MIPQEVYVAWDAKEAGARAEADWNAAFDAYRAKHSAEAAEFVRRMNGELPASWAQDAKNIIENANQKAETIASRKASQQTLDGLAAALPELLGGSADLTGSNLTNWKASKPVRAGVDTNEIQWGNHINLRRARIRHERGHQRHDGARRLSAVRWHFPHVFGLQPQRAASRGLDEGALDLRVHARLDRPR